MNHMYTHSATHMLEWLTGEMKQVFIRTLHCGV
jgi:hypothetical protein